VPQAAKIYYIYFQVFMDIPQFRMHHKLGKLLPFIVNFISQLKLATPVESSKGRPYSGIQLGRCGDKKRLKNKSRNIPAFLGTDL